MPKVSAVIPSRNRPQLVRRAVQTVLSQTYTDLKEAVVVIDGPDDTTVKVLEQMNDPRLRVIELGESVGASEARNIGAMQAHGKWIALLDDDDEWLPSKIERQLEAAEAVASPLVLVACGFILKDGNHGRSSAEAPPQARRTDQRISVRFPAQWVPDIRILLLS